MLVSGNSHLTVAETDKRPGAWRGVFNTSASIITQGQHVLIAQSSTVIPGTRQSFSRLRRVKNDKVSVSLSGDGSASVNSVTLRYGELG